MKVIQTVRGKIAPEHLGVTLMHEHTFWDQGCYRNEQPEELTHRAFLQSPVTIENLGKIHYNMHQHWDNVVQTDPDISISEMSEFKYAGGNSICDVTTYGIGRDTKGILRVAAATGLNIILGCGLYVERSRPNKLKELSRIKLTDLFIKEGTEGDENGVVSGIIGEIGISDEMSESDIELLEISVDVQKATGMAIMIHPPFFEKKAHKILDILEKSGANMQKVIYAHIDPQCEDDDYQDSIAKRGVYLEYDEFGMEFPCTLEKYVRRWLPSDIQRIRAIVRQIERGNVDRILVSQDICFKAMLKRWGGPGYSHLLENIVPSMKLEGITKEHLKTIFIDNPRTVLEVDR